MGKKSKYNLVWMDCEMTGLDVEKEVLIEIATLITDSELNVLEEGPCIAIHQRDEILDKMDEWNTKHHNSSGLVKRVQQSLIDEAEAEKRTLDFIKKYCPKGVAPLCGNSIHQDRKFLHKYMRGMHEYFHYRSIDVTSIKELVTRWYPTGPKFPKKSQEHVAMIDIRESLQELIFYRENYFIEKEAIVPESTAI
jgi:oligoribonuclease